MSMHISEDLASSGLQIKEQCFPLSTALVWSLRQRVPYHPLESENPLSSSPNTHQICQSNLAALSHMGQLYRLGCAIYLKELPTFPLCLSGESIKSHGLTVWGDLVTLKLWRRPLRYRDYKAGSSVCLWFHAALVLVEISKTAIRHC